MCEYGAKLPAQWLRVGRRKRLELLSVLEWGQANVQNELDAIALVVSSAREVLFPSRFLLTFSEDSVGTIYIRNRKHAIHSRRKATSGPGKAIRRLCSRYAVPSCAAHAWPAKRDFHVILKAVFRLVGVLLLCCADAIKVD